MTGSVDRVRAAARELGLDIEIMRMDGSTRTAEEAARQCGCLPGEIVKSLVFQGRQSTRLYLFLVAGDAQLDLARAAAAAGEDLARADPQTVREVTGFAIGGVSPIGHKTPIDTFADENLAARDAVWAAAGAPDAVFQCRAETLLTAAGARIGPLTA